MAMTASELDPTAYTKPFLDFISKNPTVYHAIHHFASRLDECEFKELKEHSAWADQVEEGGRYYVKRNGSSLIAFTVGTDYEPGNGAAIIAGHVDALTTKLKPISKVGSKAGYTQLGVAPYAGGMNETWWDRDLGVGGRVLVQNSKTKKIRTELVHTDWPIARIPTLAPHFGRVSLGPFNQETQMVPIIGLDDSSSSKDGLTQSGSQASSSDPRFGVFTSTQPPKLVAIVRKLMTFDEDHDEILSWDLELFDTQPAQLGGLDREFIFAGRIDDKLCSFAALEALVASSETSHDGDGATKCKGGIINVAALFDDEEIGSFLRQGARSNFLSSVLERTCEALSIGERYGPGVLAQTYANSFIVSADVTHAVNPNFLDVYLANHAPRLNVGVTITADPNGHMTTDAVSTALLQRIAEESNCELQVFQIRNDSRSGGTVGPMLSARTGIRAIDAGIAQLSMHSIRATTGSIDPGLGVKLFLGFYEHYENVNEEFINL